MSANTLGQCQAGRLFFCDPKTIFFGIICNGAPEVLKNRILVILSNRRKERHGPDLSIKFRLKYRDEVS